ncbi:MAG: ABC transporter substrate-binding protein [Gulosibacter sp.]|uniref:ABC transporter substrate-binding protein n=1 Tax=Gulosibacter sp. TaxID=2817531 RepID=UPI003F915CCB
MIGIALAGILTLTACTSATPQQTSAASESGGTLRAAFAGGAAETLNYFQGPTALDFVRAGLVHAPLCELGPNEEDGVSYGVLENIEISDDLSEYTLDVREGITFTDGSPLTADDVLYSLQAPTLLEGLPFVLHVSRSFDLDAATTPDEHTVVLPATTPIADGRLLLCQSMLAIQDGTVEFTESTPSSGPFTIAAFEPGQSTLLEKNPDYYGDASALDAIELISIPDGTARVTALEQGQVDYANGITPAQAQTLTGNEEISVAMSEPPYVSYMPFTMNIETEPFDDPRVREAFQLAVDRDRILENVYYGLGYLGNDLPALGFPNHNDTIPQREYDPDRARELLEEAGAVGVNIELTAGPEIAGMVETATLIVEDLQAIGVNATLQELPAGQLFADYPAWEQLPFKAGYNPPVSFETNHTPGTFPEVDELVLAARSGVTPEERLQASHDAQQLLWEEGNQIAPVFVPSIGASRSGVEGLVESQFPDLADVILID